METNGFNQSELYDEGKYICTFPEGWENWIEHNGKILVVGENIAPKVFDLKTQTWSDFTVTVDG